MLRHHLATVVPQARRAVLSLSLALMTLVPAAAPALAAAPTGDWVLTVRRTQPEQLIEFCGVEAVYDNKHNLILARTPDGKISLALGLPEARFRFEEKDGKVVPPQGKVDLEIIRSRGGPITRADQVFTATRPDFITIPLGEDPEFYDWFGRGNTLTVRGDATTLTFDLKGTLAATGLIGDCLCANNEKEPQGLRALRVLLETAGLRNFDFVGVDQGSALGRFADVLWFYGTRVEGCKLRADEDAVGGLFERRVKTDDSPTFATLVEDYFTHIRTGCEADVEGPKGVTLPGGTFSVVERQEPESRSGVTVMRADTRCLTPPATDAAGAEVQPGNDNRAALVLASDGKTFTVFFHLGPSDNLRNLKARRDSVYRLLRVLRPVDGAAAAAPAQ